MLGLAMACHRRACGELALNCKVVLGHILSGIESKDRPSGLESENGAQARDHIGLLAVGLIRFAVG